MKLKMTNNPREIAIEKLFNIFNLAYSEHESWDVSTCEKAGIGAILDALNIEALSKENEVKEGDIVRLGDWHFEIINDSDNPYNSVTLEHFNNADKYKRIIQLNDKPVIYIENIGVKNDK